MRFERANQRQERLLVLGGGGLSLSVSVPSGRKVINILFGGGRAPGIPEHSTAVPFSRFIGMRVEEEVE